MIFFGTYKHSLDSKNRLALPAKFIEKLKKTVYLTKGFDGCLELRNEDSFKEYCEKLLSLESNSNDVRQVQRVFLSSTNKIDIDVSNRILLPTNLMEKVDIKKNVTIIGVGNHIEIWDEEKYSKYEKDAEQKYEEASLNIANTYGKK